MTDYNDVPVEDDSIKLGQFLKLANLIESGGEAKRVLAGGIVRVNGEVESRRGRQLERGDVVSVAAKSARVGGEREWVGSPSLGLRGLDAVTASQARPCAYSTFVSPRRSLVPRERLLSSPRAGRPRRPASRRA